MITITIINTVTRKYVVTGRYTQSLSDCPGPHVTSL